MGLNLVVKIGRVSRDGFAECRAVSGPHTVFRHLAPLLKQSPPKKRLAGDTARAATSDEVKDLRREATALKEVVADLTLENRLLKKSVTADGEDEA